MSESTINIIEERTSAAQNIFTFINNFPHDFIEQAFGDEGQLMVDHFKAKWSGYCEPEGYGSANAFMQFYINLSNHYQRKLCRFMDEWMTSKKLRP